MTTAVFVLALIVAAGTLYQSIGAWRDASRWTVPGSLIGDAGQQLHVLCMGDGDPPVVFESGIAASSLSWTRIVPGVAAFTRACAYDRAGLGWSDRPAVRASVSDMVSHLRTVAASASNHGRSILVGHSFGAFLISIYAAQHPREVAGLVLLDPPAEWHEPARERQRLLWGGIQMARLGALLARVGVVRACLALLTGGAPGVPRRFVRVFGPTTAQTLERLVGEVRKLPPEVHPMVRAMWCRPKCFHAMADHLRALAETAALAGAIRSFGDLPLVVVSSASQPPDIIARHVRLAALSTRGRHLVAARAGHWIPLDAPQLVVAVVRDVYGMANSR
jgi:pimeloyl-ACP methyl ester carboxylesterase